MITPMTTAQNVKVGAIRAATEGLCTIMIARDGILKRKVGGFA